MIADVLLRDASRWPVLAFASVHVLGLLTHHPVPWSATLTATSLLVIASRRNLALLPGLAAVTGLVALVEYRGGGLGWPFFLTSAPTGGPAVAEAALITAAVLALSAAALLPAHGADTNLRALLDGRRVLSGRLRTLAGRLRTWHGGRRTAILDLRSSPLPPGATTGPLSPSSFIDLDRPMPRPGPAAGGPVVFDLGTLVPHDAGPVSDTDRPGWSRRRLTTAGTVAATALALLIATRPLWTRDHYGQLPLTTSRDGTGLLLAVVPALLAVAAGTVAACRSLVNARRGTAFAALALVALTMPVAWTRGGEHRFTPAPPPTQVLHVATLTEQDYRPDPGWLPPPLVHPAPSTVAAEPAGGLDDGVLSGLALTAFLALIAALIPAMTRPAPPGGTLPPR